MENKLPKGWSACLLEEIVSYRKGKKPNRLEKSQFPHSVPYLDIKAIEKKIIEQYADINSSNLTNSNEILIVWDGARSGWAGKSVNGAIGSTLMALRPFANKEYLYWFLRSQFEHINSNPRGTGIPHVDPKLFWNISVPIPSLAEQQRIVAKLDALMVRIQTCRERLEKIPDILKRFRQSVLAAAVSGELTEEWRRKNSAVNAYSIKNSCAFEIDEFFNEVPENWRITQLGELTSLITSGSRGWAKYYSNSGSIFIRAQNINSDVLNLEDIAFVKLPNNTEGLRTRVQQHDLLITITGANVTKSAIVEQPIDDAYVSQHVALVRLSDVYLSKFLFLSIVSSSHGRKQLLNAAYGQGKPGLNLDNIRKVVVSVPPILEQQEIIRRVKELFHYADNLEARYQKAKAFVDKLPQALLAKAFRGELVPQDENDEPASVLLERIRLEKDKTATMKKSGKQEKQKAKEKKGKITANVSR